MRRRTRHQQVIQRGQLRRCIGLEQRSVPDEAETSASAVENDEAPNPLRLVECDPHRDPSAHRPARQIRLLQVAIIHEGFHRARQLGDRVRGVGGPVRAPVARQIERVHAMVIAHQLRHQIRPVFGAPAQAVHQHDRRTRSAGVVVNADMRISCERYRRVLRVDAVEQQAGLGRQPQHGQRPHKSKDDHENQKHQDAKNRPANRLPPPPGFCFG